MSDLILHIGMPKTGSTSIQFALYRLNSEKFIYPDLGEVNHNRSLCSLFSKNPLKLHFNQGITVEEMNEYIKSVRYKLEKLLQTENYKCLVFSGEAIPLLSEDEIFDMKKFFSKYNRNKILVCAYVRPPIEYLNSAFQQSLKNYFTSFNNLSKLLPKYKETFEKFDKIFGKDNVQLYKFDRNDFPEKNVVSDFCSRFGIEIDSSKIVFANESLSLEAVKFIYLYKKFTKKRLYIGEAKWISSFITNCTNDRKKFKISPVVLKPIIERVRNDIEWMEKRLGKSLDEVIEDDPRDIKSEEDLLNIDEDIKEKLLIHLDIPHYNLTGNQIIDAINIMDRIRMKYKESFLNKGIILKVTPRIIAGFAIGDNFETPVKLYLYVNGKLRDETLANEYCLTLFKMGASQGKNGFRFLLKNTNFLRKGDVIEIIAKNSSCKIQNSPFVFKNELHLTWAHLLHIMKI